MKIFMGIVSIVGLYFILGMFPGLHHSFFGTGLSWFAVLFVLGLACIIKMMGK